MTKKKLRRVVLHEGYLYQFYDGSKCIRLDVAGEKNFFKNIKQIRGKKLRLIAEMLP